MSARRRLVVDTETTSLTPDYRTGAGVIWELALIDRESGQEWLWRMKPDASKADPGALQVGRYYERTEDTLQHSDSQMIWNVAAHPAPVSPYWSNPDLVAAFVVRLLDGATLIAANPTFDANYLSAFLGTHGQSRQPWHYRLRDIGSMACGYLSACQALGIEGRDAALGVPPMDASTDEFALALGLDLSKYERHSALGDCRLVSDMLSVIEGAR